jgi:hypothetical protein
VSDYPIDDDLSGLTAVRAALHSFRHPGGKTPTGEPAPKLKGHNMYEEVTLMDEEFALAAQIAAAQLADPAHDRQDCDYCLTGEADRWDEARDEQARGRLRELMKDFSDFSRNRWVGLIDDIDPDNR